MTMHPRLSSLSFRLLASRFLPPSLTGSHQALAGRDPRTVNQRMEQVLKRSAVHPTAGSLALLRRLPPCQHLTRQGVPRELNSLLL